ncbi:MAG: polysaccharide biosynthesis C-terminal domain-containing protein [Lachnospiraceae bacterium]|nr:polysaccharide biosynthesis C-terminal domain-containing protein [Lachnospiraceae bacterium]
MRSRSKKASINITVMATYEIVAFVCGLILPRLILGVFGSTYNGVVSSATQFLSYISILRLGIAGSTRVALYKVLADNDIKGISGIVNATEKYMRKIGLILIAYITILALVYPYISNTGLDRLTVALLIIIVGTSTFAEYFFGITYNTLLSADQSQYIYYAIQIGAKIVNVIVAAILIWLGGSIFVVYSGSAAVYVASPIILKIIVSKKYSIDKSVLPNNVGLKDRWNVMGHSIANIVHNNTDMIVLTIFCDIKIVSVYTVYYLVINGLKQIMNVFTNGLEGAFGNMFAKGEIELAKRNFDTFEYIMGVFGSIVFSCALLLIIPFIKLYTNGITDVNYIVPAFGICAVVAQLLFCIRQPYLTIVQAAGHYKQTRNGAFFEAIINITISVVLVFKFGIVGVTIGTLIANAFRTLQYAVYLKQNILNRKIKKFIKTISWITVNIILTSFICSKITNLNEINTWGAWISNGAICCFVAAIVTLLSSIIIYKKMIKMTIDLLNRMIKR